MRILFAGHDNFGNRGCEALIRSITRLVRQRIPDAQFLCPSRMPELDAAQWPEAAAAGVRFVPHARLCATLRWWGRFHRAFPPVRRWDAPRVGLDGSTAAAVGESDVVILTGGDILGLEYGLPSLFHWTNLIENAVRCGKPAILWGASIGPFSAEPVVERQLSRHLRHYDAITVRETSSLNYLRRMGLTDVSLVSDPAFTLEPQPFECGSLTFGGNAGLLGLNVSPLIRRFFGSDQQAELLDQELVRFISGIIQETSYKVLLIPHVDPLDGSVENSDSAYLELLLERAGGPSSRLAMAPRTLNAAQLKYLIAQCKHFIGARTHATIAALSSGVPTVSIAYSAKAKGINQDIFGDTRHVVETQRVSSNALRAALVRLAAEDASIRDMLARQQNQWREAAAAAVATLMPEPAVARATRQFSSAVA